MSRTYRKGHLVSTWSKVNYVNYWLNRRVSYEYDRVDTKDTEERYQAALKEWKDRNIFWRTVIDIHKPQRWQFQKLVRYVTETDWESEAKKQVDSYDRDGRENRYRRYRYDWSGDFKGKFRREQKEYCRKAFRGEDPEDVPQLKHSDWDDYY